jgi:hypothetical protein
MGWDGMGWEDKEGKQREVMGWEERKGMGRNVRKGKKEI